MAREFLRLVRLPALACCLLVPLSGSTLAQTLAQQEGPDTLTSAERALAGRLSEEAVRPLRTEAPMYLVSMELLRPKAPDDARQAVVTHYRYDRDLAILTTVDLARGRLVALDTVPHLAVAFAQEEVEAARRLARADERVRRALAPYGDRVRIEALPLRTASREDRLFGHRVLRLLFRVPRGYLEEPVVLVDLTTEEVIIE